MRALLGALALHVRLLRAPEGPTKCPRAAAPVAKATPEGLEEASGLATSDLHAGRFYTMVDTPPKEGPHVFLLSPDGVVEEAYTFRLDSSHPFGKTGLGDWEGIAVGPCAAGGEPCLFVADTGHNCAREDCKWLRDWYRVLRIPEDKLPRGPRASGPIAVESLWFQYPAKANYDAEALLSHPTGALFLLTKDNAGLARIFTIDLCEDTTLTEVGSVSFPGYLVTGGAIDASGERLLLRMYKVGGRPEDEASGRLLFYRLQPVPLPDGKACGSRARLAVQAAGRAVAAALAGPGCDLPAAQEPQGEGCAFLPGSPPAGYATLSEQSAPLHVTLFRSLAPLLVLSWAW